MRRAARAEGRGVCVCVCVQGVLVSPGGTHPSVDLSGLRPMAPSSRLTPWAKPVRAAEAGAGWLVRLSFLCVEERRKKRVASVWGANVRGVRLAVHTRLCAQATAFHAPAWRGEPRLPPEPRQGLRMGPERRAGPSPPSGPHTPPAASGDGVAIATISIPPRTRRPTPAPARPGGHQPCCGAWGGTWPGTRPAGRPARRAC